MVVQLFKLHHYPFGNTPSDELRASPSPRETAGLGNDVDNCDCD